jgi:hypothetical protein
MSHLAHHIGQHRQAIQLAHRGQQALERAPRLPELDARLLAMQARGFAAFREPGTCTRLLTQAEAALAIPGNDEPSPWVSRFDEGSLASEAARCMRHLDDLDGAYRQAQRIITLRSGDRTRSRAFGQLILVTVLVRQGRPDEACAVAQEVLDATQSLGSYLVIQQLHQLIQILDPYRGSRVVTGFLACLGETLRERAWLYQSLTAAGRRHPTGPGEDQ